MTERKCKEDKETENDGHDWELVWELGADLRKYNLARPLWGGDIWIKWKNKPHNLGAEYNGKSIYRDPRVETAGSFGGTKKNGVWMERNKRGDRQKARLLMFFQAMKDPGLYFEWDEKPLGASAQEKETWSIYSLERSHYISQRKKSTEHLAHPVRTLFRKVPFLRVVKSKDKYQS